MALVRGQDPLVDFPLRNTNRFMFVGMKINIVTLCSGMEAQGQALKRLCADCPELEWELLAWSEIDSNAIKAHNAVFPEYADRNLGDMTKCDYSSIKEQVDVLFYSTPCQSVSVAGARKGMKEGDDAASALIWHTRRAIKELRPRIAILENVKGMIMGENRKEFHKWQHELESYGYTNFAKVLDARDYGVAQHRERLFMVSILDCDEPYYFPTPFPLTKRLKDYLEKDVPESYYLKPGQVKRIIEHCDKKQAQGCGFSTQFTAQDGIVGTILTRCGNQPTDPYVQEPAIIGYSRSNDGVGISYHVKDVSNTIHTSSAQGGNTDQYVKEPVSDVRYSVQSNQSGVYFREPLKEVSKTLRADDKMCVCEPCVWEVKQLAQIYPDSGNPQAGRIYDINGISPNLDTCSGGNRMPKILTPVRTEEAKELRSNTITTVTKDKLVQEPVACAVRGRDSESGVTKQKLEIGDTTANCITSVQKDSMVAEPAADTIIASYPPNVSEKTQFANDIPNPSVWVDPETNKAYYYKEGCLWRIRKLMPSECLRLMSVSDDDIEKIRNCGISKTAIYSLAGNSICVEVLFHLFKKLFIDKSNPNQQLTLF